MNQEYHQKKLLEYAAANFEDVALANSIAFVKLSENGTIDGVTAGEHLSVFEAWQPSIEYAVGNLRKYNDKLYRCIQAHTSQTDWTPEATPSLWAVASDPTVEYPEWSQPVGAHDAYGHGDKVAHSGKRWMSSIDGNIWEPGVYGWDEVV